MQQHLKNLKIEPGNVLQYRIYSSYFRVLQTRLFSNYVEFSYTFYLPKVLRVKNRKRMRSVTVNMEKICYKNSCIKGYDLMLRSASE